MPDKIKRRARSSSGTDATYQPNEYLDNDGKTVIGMDVGTLRRRRRRLGLKTEWAPTGFDQIILGVGSGKYDVGVSSFTINADRMKVAHRWCPTQSRHPVGCRQGNPEKVDPVANACGKKVAAQKATVQSDGLPQAQQGLHDAGKAPIQLLIDADQGKVTAMVQKQEGRRDDGGPVAAIAAVGDDQWRGWNSLASNTIRRRTGMFLPKDQTAFGEAIVGALKGLAADGTYKAILASGRPKAGPSTTSRSRPSVG